jgi:hypothetical protein
MGKDKPKTVSVRRVNGEGTRPATLAGSLTSVYRDDGRSVIEPPQRLSRDLDCLINYIFASTDRVPHRQPSQGVLLCGGRQHLAISTSRRVFERFHDRDQRFTHGYCAIDLRLVMFELLYRHFHP